MKKEDVKKFFKEHKTKIAIGAIATVGVVCAAMAAREDKNGSAPVADGAAKMPWAMPNNVCDIDEAIFTDLAPEIEDAMFTVGRDESYIERTYHVEWPKRGDINEGTYEEVKKVMVHILDVTEP